MPAVLAAATNAFPLWVLAGSLLALWHPPLFTWFTGPRGSASANPAAAPSGLTDRS